MNSYSSLNRVVVPDSPPPHKKPKTFWSRFLTNLPLKLISLVCSLILFIVVMSDRNMTLNFEKIPVNIRMPDGFASVDGTSETTVDVQVHGRASLLRGMSRDDVGVISIMPPGRTGNVQVTLQNEMLSLPEGVRIDKFTPEFVGVNLEPLEHRTVAVTTDHAFTGELMPGYQLGEVRIEPENIEISGPKSLIEETSQLYIEPIDLTGKAATFTVNRWVILNRVGIQAKSDKVEVTVSIMAKSQQHVVLGVKIVPLNLSLIHEFVPEKVDLTLVGDEEALAKIDTSKLFVTVDASEDEEKGTHTRLLTGSDFQVPNLPQGVGFDEKKIPSVLLKVWSKSDTDDL
ncbi:MAG: YbbR-like domain-containing protein [Proteobacteria bacterium]|nr:YbbR-like domain-containing protein [Pseudomonadota bacterium]